MKLHYADVNAVRPEAGTDLNTWIAGLYTGVFENRLRGEYLDVEAIRYRILEKNA
jgi:hypothetical protein